MVSAGFVPSDLSVNGLGEKDLLHTAFEVILRPSGRSGPAAVLPPRRHPESLSYRPATHAWGSNVRRRGRYQKALCFTGLRPRQEGQKH